MKNSTLSKLVIACLVVSGLTFLAFLGILIAVIFSSGVLSEGLQTIDTIWNKGFYMTVPKNNFRADEGSMALLPTNFLTDSMSHAFTNLEKDPQFCNAASLIAQFENVFGTHEQSFQATPVPAAGESLTCPTKDTPCVCQDSQRGGLFGDSQSAICENQCSSSGTEARCITSFTDSRGNSVTINCGTNPTQSVLNAIPQTLLQMMPASSDASSDYLKRAYIAYELSNGSPAVFSSYLSETEKWLDVCKVVWGIHALSERHSNSNSSQAQTVHDIYSQKAHDLPGCGAGSGPSPTPFIDDYLPYVDPSGGYLTCSPGNPVGSEEKQVFESKEKGHCIAAGHYDLCGKVPLGDEDQYRCVGHMYDYSALVPFPTKAGIRLPSSDMPVVVPPLKS